MIYTPLIWHMSSRTAYGARVVSRARSRLGTISRAEHVSVYAIRTGKARSRSETCPNGWCIFTKVNGETYASFYAARRAAY